MIGKYGVTLAVALAVLSASPGRSRAEWILNLQGSAAFTGMNDARIPGDGGTKLSLSDELDADAVLAGRVEGTHRPRDAEQGQDHAVRRRHCAGRAPALARPCGVGAAAFLPGASAVLVGLRIPRPRPRPRLAAGPGEAWAAASASPGGSIPWWVWALILLAFSFVVGIVSLLGGMGGGTLFVSIISGFLPFHLDFVRCASLLVALTIMVLDILLATACGYGLAKFRFKGRQLVFILILATMMIPFETVMIPLLMLTIKLKIQDTYVTPRGNSSS